MNCNALETSLMCKTSSMTKCDAALSEGFGEEEDEEPPVNRPRDRRGGSPKLGLEVPLIQIIIFGERI